METYEKENLVVKVSNEYYADNPRNWDNFSKMVCSHRRYDIGDSHNINFKDFNSWSEVEEHLIKKHGAKVILPVYMYDHGGIDLSHTPYSCSWDSGQVGFIYATKESIKKEYGRMTKKVLDKVEQVLISKLEVYSYYVSGEVYLIELFEKGSDECYDSTSIYGYTEMMEEVKRLTA